MQAGYGEVLHRAGRYHAAPGRRRRNSTKRRASSCRSDPWRAPSAGVDADRRQAAEAAVKDALMPYDGADGIKMPARIWVVTARAADTISAAQ